MVWYEGLDNWVKAGEVEELKVLFKSVPPPLNKDKPAPTPINVKTKQVNNPVDNKAKEKNKKTGLIIGSIIALALILFFVMNYSQSSSNSNDNSSSSSNNLYSKPSTEENNYTPPPKEKTEKELKRELAIKECKRPTKYLKETTTSLKGVYKNALSMKFNAFKVKFRINNTATVMTFKNVKCRVTLSSNSGSTILVKNFTVSEFIRAGNSVSYKGEFSCSNQQFKDTDKYSIDIIGAECH